MSKQEKGNYYSTLGVEQSATKGDIKKAYRKLALLFHPDKHMDKTEAEKIKLIGEFKKVNNAHEVLSNENSRVHYDESLRHRAAAPQRAAAAKGAAGPKRAYPKQSKTERELDLELRRMYAEAEEKIQREAEELAREAIQRGEVTLVESDPDWREAEERALARIALNYLINHQEQVRKLEKDEEKRRDSKSKKYIETIEEIERKMEKEARKIGKKERKEQKELKAKLEEEARKIEEERRKEEAKRYEKLQKEFKDKEQESKETTDTSPCVSLEDLPCSPAERFKPCCIPFKRAKGGEDKTCSPLPVFGSPFDEESMEAKRIRKHEACSVASPDESLGDCTPSTFSVSRSFAGNEAPKTLIEIRRERALARAEEKYKVSPLDSIASPDESLGDCTPSPFSVFGSPFNDETPEMQEGKFVVPAFPSLSETRAR